MKRLSLLFLLFLVAPALHAQQPFITTWQATGNPISFQGMTHGQVVLLR